jgi:hypothetical protein
VELIKQRGPILILPPLRRPDMPGAARIWAGHGRIGWPRGHLVAAFGSAVGALTDRQFLSTVALKRAIGTGAQSRLDVPKRLLKLRLGKRLARGAFSA